MDFLTATRQMLKDYCAQNGIVPDGDKRKVDTWRDAAIAFFQSTLESAEQSLGELFAEADRIGTKYQDPEEVASKAIELAQLTKDILDKAVETTKKATVTAFEIATCPKAIELYRRTAYLAAMAVLLVICSVIAIGRMVLEHERNQTAIGEVRSKAAEFAQFIRSRSVAFWDWIRSTFDREVQSVVNLVSLAYLDLME